MRIKIVGDNSSAATLRNYLSDHRVGYTVTDLAPSYTVHIEETDCKYIIVDSIDSELERHAVNMIDEVLQRGSQDPILLQRAGGIQSEREIRISVPRTASAMEAVEIGLLRALMMVGRHGAPKVGASKGGLMKRMLARMGLGVVLLSALMARAQDTHPTGAVAAGGSSTVTQGTAAASTAGWPITLGNVARASAAWTNATALDTALSLGITNTGSVILTMNSTSTITGGQLNFEASDDGSTWFPVTGARTNAFTSEGTFTITATTKIAWGMDVGTFTNVRVRLNPAITGTGTVTVALTASAASIEPEVVVGQSNASNLNATDVGTKTNNNAAPGATNLGVLPCIATAADQTWTEGNEVNCSVDLSGFGRTKVSNWLGSTAPTVGQKAMASSIPITWASDQSALPTGANTIGKISDITATVTPGTAAANLGKAEDAASVSADTGVFILGVRNDGGSTQTTNANGDYTQFSVDSYGALYTRGHPNPVNCTADNIAATLTQLTNCGQPGAGLSVYVTDIVAESTTATAGAMTLEQGTGTNCGTGTAAFYPPVSTARTILAQANTNTAGPTQIHFFTPMKAVANDAICVLGVATNTTNILLTGFIAP